MSADELEASLALEEWEARQLRPPSIFEVVETGDAQLIGAYILRGFRQATRQVVGGNHGVMELRELPHLAFESGDAAENFLRVPDQQLDGRTPLQAALASGSGRNEAVRLLTPRLRGAAMRIFDRLSQAWDLSERERSGLLGAEPEAVLRWHDNPNEAPISAVERISILLGIFRAINALLPQNGSADFWVRRPNDAPLFGGRTALQFMLEAGLSGLRDVRAYLDAELRHH